MQLSSFRLTLLLGLLTSCLLEAVQPHEIAVGDCTMKLHEAQDTSWKHFWQTKYYGVEVTGRARKGVDWP
eukprot:6457372-Amphidinium_carterae.1